MASVIRTQDADICADSMYSLGLYFPWVQAQGGSVADRSSMALSLLRTFTHTSPEPTSVEEAS